MKLTNETFQAEPLEIKALRDAISDGRASNECRQRLASQPISARECPRTHPIKGNCTYGGERRFFHALRG